MIEDLHIELQYRRTPVDELEPLEISPADYREAALKHVAVLNDLIERIQAGFRNGNAEVAFWGCCYGLGTSNCEGTSMTEKAEQLGVCRAAISKQARAFIEANDLPPSWYMKNETDNYLASRLAQLNNGNGSNGAEHP